MSHARNIVTGSVVPALLLLGSGCASFDSRDPVNAPPPHTHPHAGCNNYPPNQVGSHSYHVSRTHIDCPKPLPGLSSTTGGEKRHKVILTTDLIRRMRLSPDQLANLQFYTSHRIILQRELAGADQYVQGGRLVTRDGRYLDQVVIERGTPGVATHIDGQSITIDFGQGSPLKFGLPPTLHRSWSNPLHRSYRLLAWGWQGNNTAKVHFDNKVYRAVGPSAAAALLIDQDELRQVSTQRRVLPGKSLFEGDAYPYEYDETYGAYVPRQR